MARSTHASPTSTQILRQILCDAGIKAAVHRSDLAYMTGSGFRSSGVEVEASIPLRRTTPAQRDALYAAQQTHHGLSIDVVGYGGPDYPESGDLVMRLQGWR